MNSAILAAIAALVGIAVGRLWDARSESTRWRRDQKTASYQRFAEEFQSIYEVIRALAIVDPDTDTFAGMVADARTNGFKAWDSAFIAVWLHGSAPVVSAATTLDRRVTELFYEAQQRRTPAEPSWSTQRRNTTSPYPGGDWPIHIDPDDITRVYFRDPAPPYLWHTLEWEHAPSLGMPFSEDALQFARRLAAAKYTYPDDRIAVADLLERWGLGLGSSMQERRMALRLARKQSSFIASEVPEPGEVSKLPSLAKVLALAAGSGDASTDSTLEEAGVEEGDDDADDDLDGAASGGFADPDQLDPDELDEDDFYADALEDV